MSEEARDNTRGTSPQERVAVREENRAGARFRVFGLRSRFGELIDLSARGMRIRTTRRWHEGFTRRLTISSGSRSVTVDARCIWCRQDSMFSHTVGLAFEQVTPEQATVLWDLTRLHAEEKAQPLGAG